MITVSSLYCPPFVSSLAYQLIILDNVKNLSRLVIDGDFNARNPIWSQRTATDIRGKELEDFLASKNLVVLNDPNKSTYGMSGDPSPDVTAVSASLLSFVEDSDVLFDHISMTAHSYVLFTQKFEIGCDVCCNHNDCKFDYRKANWDKCISVLLNRIDSVYSMPFFTKNEIDLASDNFTNLIRQAMLDSIPTQKHGPKSRKYVRWLNPDLSAKR